MSNVRLASTVDDCLTAASSSMGSLSSACAEPVIGDRSRYLTPFQVPPPSCKTGQKLQFFEHASVTTSAAMMSSGAVSPLPLFDAVSFVPSLLPLPKGRSRLIRETRKKSSSPGSRRWCSAHVSVPAVMLNHAMLLTILFNDSPSSPDTGMWNVLLLPDAAWTAFHSATAATTSNP